MGTTREYVCVLFESVAAGRIVLDYVNSLDETSTAKLAEKRKEFSALAGKLQPRTQA